MSILYSVTSAADRIGRESIPCVCLCVCLSVCLYTFISCTQWSNERYFILPRDPHNIIFHTQWGNERYFTLPRDPHNILFHTQWSNERYFTLPRDPHNILFHTQWSNDVISLSHVILTTFYFIHSGVTMLFHHFRCIHQNFGLSRDSNPGL